MNRIVLMIDFKDTKLDMFIMLSRVLCIKRPHYISYDKLESAKTKQKQTSKTKQKDWIQTKTCQLEYVMQINIVRSFVFHI